MASQARKEERIGHAHRNVTKFEENGARRSSANGTGCTQCGRPHKCLMRQETFVWTPPRCCHDGLMMPARGGQNGLPSRPGSGRSWQLALQHVYSMSATASFYRSSRVLNNKLILSRNSGMATSKPYIKEGQWGGAHRKDLATLWCPHKCLMSHEQQQRHGKQQTVYQRRTVGWQ